MRAAVENEILTELDGLKEQLELSRHRLRLSMEIMAGQVKVLPDLEPSLMSLLRSDDEVSSRLYAIDELKEATSDAVELEDLYALKEFVQSLRIPGSALCTVHPGLPN